jgi:hypothetical protein
VSDVAYVRRVFGPEELRELGVAFENCCAAIPEAQFQEFRELLAVRLVRWATLGKVDSIHLYLRALHTYRSLVGPPQL